ncbi:DUF2510 domain-containing protein [Propionicimonas sp.]|uniref:DUF2510 domain-containing protein n=1 Tax=Propionicimonas sp. TaxID=1955623 RepID=UPI0017F04EB0|nr:DUF2510 domain-containing protein [Propionicimonas sp.]MBU3977505.1 DUF2510 domain-containing protein [Actinomycetota bacterium]MBU3986015.1 DUF2510 domain-containing protein [Actinomycetota bacterium]MBU4008800.1 DUF2510 domain-containing protein [Actinomycetota bacterium]MBU4066050.1 DUF2510 domain-containing protein [Actinomycetota bacterium]
MNSPQPPPAWYQDHSDPALLRWWDGRQWTGHTHPKPTAASAAPRFRPEKQEAWAPDVAAAKPLWFVWVAFREPNEPAPAYRPGGGAYLYGWPFSSLPKRGVRAVVDGFDGPANVVVLALATEQDAARLRSERVKIKNVLRLASVRGT